MMKKPLSVARRAARLLSSHRERVALLKSLSYVQEDVVVMEGEGAVHEDEYRELLQQIEYHEDDIRSIGHEIQAITRCRALRGILPAKVIDAIQLSTPGVNRDTKVVHHPFVEGTRSVFVDVGAIEDSFDELHIMKIDMNSRVMFKYAYSVFYDRIYYEFYERQFC